MEAVPVCSCVPGVQRPLSDTGNENQTGWLAHRLLKGKPYALCNSVGAPVPFCPSGLLGRVLLWPAGWLNAIRAESSLSETI